MINNLFGAVVTLCALIVTGFVIHQSLNEMIKRNERHAERWRMINKLCDAGAIISISYDGRDGYTLLVNARWTTWHDCTYDGGTIDIALAQAVTAMERAQ